MKWFLVLIFLLGVQNAYSARILGLFHMTARSHYILGSSLMRELAERGHDVTVISPFGEKEPPKNGSYRDIILTGFAEEHDKQVKEISSLRKSSLPQFLMPLFMAKRIIELTEKTLNHTNVQKLIHSGETFDVVIVEEFMNQAHKALANHFQANLITLSTMGANSWTNQLIGNPTPLAYVSDMMLASPSDMRFSQRLANTLSYVWTVVIQELYAIPKQAGLVKTYFPQGPNLKDVMYNISLVLVNSHPSTNQPVPYVPQMVDIGGFHVKPPKPLPKDLQDYLDNAKNGVIYFSLGTNSKSSFLPVEKLQAFKDAFSKLQEDVLWKWEEDELAGKPSNVRIAKWLPQQDILAHPNVKLFVTHAGLLSTIETIYHGMPVVAIPLGGDQKLNAQQIANQGFGVKLNFADVTEETITTSINEVLTNDKYRKNANARSEFFHDRLVSPMDTAVYWVEYVIRHGGTKHLRVAGLDLPWYKYFLLDVIATIVLVLFVVCKIIKKLFKLCTKKVPKQKQQ